MWKAARACRDNPRRNGTSAPWRERASTASGSLDERQRRFPEESSRAAQNDIVAAVDDAKHVAHDPLAVEERPAGNARPVFEWIFHADIIPKPIQI